MSFICSSLNPRSRDPMVSGMFMQKTWGEEKWVVLTKESVMTFQRQQLWPSPDCGSCDLRTEAFQLLLPLWVESWGRGKWEWETREHQPRRFVRGAWIHRVSSHMFTVRVKMCVGYIWSLVWLTCAESHTDRKRKYSSAGLPHFHSWDCP
jgi:hypothetical protein